MTLPANWQRLPDAVLYDLREDADDDEVDAIDDEFSKRDHERNYPS